MIKIAEYNELTILKKVGIGLMLGDESGEEALLYNAHCPTHYLIDDKIKVFVYPDNTGTKIATTKTPTLTRNEFGLLKVNAVAEVGAFLDWGIEKDLMSPFKEQYPKMEEDRWYLVFLDIEAETGRPFASSKIEKYLQNDELTVQQGDEVEVCVWKKTDLGFSVIVNNEHTGLVYENEIFKTLNVGDKFTGFVKNIREDNKMDISMQPLGYENFNDANCDVIFQALQKSNGFLPLNDKSSPEDISSHFGMSKKAFKKALGALYKLRKITIDADGIKLS